MSVVFEVISHNLFYYIDYNLTKQKPSFGESNNMMMVKTIYTYVYTYISILNNENIKLKVRKK